MTFLDWVSLRKFFDGLIYQHCRDNKGSGCTTENRKGTALEARRSELAGWNVLFPEMACLIYWRNLRNVTSLCGFDLADKDSKYLIVVVKLCMEGSSRVSPRKLRLLLLTKSQAWEAPPAAGSHFLLGFWGRMSGQLASPKRKHGGQKGFHLKLRGTNTAFMGVTIMHQVCIS